MPRSLYSTWCLVPTILYIVIAIYINYDDRHNVGGGWISLNGMSSYIITLPISAFFDALLGLKLDYRRNLDMAFAILGTATCIYLALFGAATLVQTMFAPPPSSPR